MNLAGDCVFQADPPPGTETRAARFIRDCRMNMIISDMCSERTIIKLVTADNTLINGGKVIQRRDDFLEDVD